MTLKWAVPRNGVVGKNDARTNLSAIVSFVQETEKAVYIGGLNDQFCAFITISEYEKNSQDVYCDGVEDCEIDVVRKMWSLKRRVVENTGQVLRITKDGMPVACIVPTQKAYDTNIDAARRVIQKQTREIIADEFLRSELAAELTKLSRTARSIKRDVKELKVFASELASLFPSSEELSQFRQGLGLVRTTLSEWRREKGFGPALGG
jgi:antitoxin (DNA-binding transcriptional repressor) of toxin-antitoxin stability system